MMTIEQAIEKYSKLKSYDERKAFREEYAKELMEQTPIEELAKEWFKDYGTANGWSPETSFKYFVASILHAEHMKKYPEMHKKLPQKYHWNCWEEDNCSCGLCASWDSSD